MKTMKHWWLLLLAVAFFNGCKPEFDEPPGSGEDPVGVSANTSIEELKALYDISGDFLTIDDDIIIEGIVVADDKSGNFYKSIVIQDATAGIMVKIDATDLFNEYPVGRRVFIKCKGLVLGDYNDLIELGIGTDNTDPTDPELLAIPYYLKDDYILKGKYGLTVDPLDLTIDELDADREAYTNMLVRISGVEFIDADAGQPFADAINKISKNRTLQDCDANEVILRTSGYANFAVNNTPTGNGEIVAIFSIFRDDNQLYIRDLNDVAGMTGLRCDDGGGGELFKENFESTSAGSITLAGWTNFSQIGTKDWYNGFFDSNRYAQFTPFGSGEASNIGWLITPDIDLATGNILTFRSKTRFYDAGYTPLEVLISTNYDGSDVLSATWTPLSASISATSDLWVASGNISLSTYNSQTVHIAFRCTGSGTDTDKDAAMQIDDIKVQ